MTNDELRALADALDDEDFEFRDSPMRVRRKWADYLRAQAEAQPVAWSDGLGSFIEADEKVGDDPDILAYRVPLYAAPVQQQSQGWTGRHISVTRFALLAFINDAYVRANRAAQRTSPEPAENVAKFLDDARTAEEARAMLAAAPAAPQAEPIDPHMIAAEDRFPDEPAEPKEENNVWKQIIPDDVPQAEQPIDLDAVAMQQMRQAAAESTWMPSEYTSNDWIADVCRWLRDGPPAAAPQAEPCIGNDPACPCQDGDACHYKDGADGTKAWSVPQAELKREPLSDEPPSAEWLSKDDAETQLALAMRYAAKIAPSTDDKALLDALSRRGIWLAWIGGSDAE